MKVKVIVKATKESEAEMMPDEKSSSRWASSKRSCA